MMPLYKFIFSLANNEQQETHIDSISEDWKNISTRLLCHVDIYVNNHRYRGREYFDIDGLQMIMYDIIHHE
jgi:hypothetical protein